MELAQQDWSEYFQGITGEPGRLLVAIESLGRHSLVDERIDAMCDGVCTRHPLRTIGYEASGDVFEVAVGLIADHGPLLRFFVAAPRRIVVREADAVRAIIVTDAGDSRTVVVLFPVQPRGPRTAARTRLVDCGHAHRRNVPEARHALARGGPGPRAYRLIERGRARHPHLDVA